MELKITIALDERAHDTLNKLAEALSKEIRITATPTMGEIKPVAQPKATVEQTPTKAEKTPQAQTVEPKTEKKQQVETKIGLEPQAEEVAKVQNSAVTIEELRGLAADAKERTGTAKSVKDLITEYGATKLSEIPNDKWEEFKQRLKELK